LSVPSASAAICACVGDSSRTIYCKLCATAPQAAAKVCKSTFRINLVSCSKIYLLVLNLVYSPPGGWASTRVTVRPYATVHRAVAERREGAEKPGACGDTSGVCYMCHASVSNLLRISHLHTSTSTQHTCSDDIYHAHDPGAMVSTGRHCRSTLSLTEIDCHSLGIYTVVLLPLLSFSSNITASPMANIGGRS
jgi:hypothetical protein